MGYELHITRAEDWRMSSERPIGSAEWDAVAGRHSGDLYPLTLGSELHPRQYAWQGPRGALMYLEDGQVTIKGVRDQGEVGALVALAEEIGARLIGDDGEVY